MHAPPTTWSKLTHHVAEPILIARLTAPDWDRAGEACAHLLSTTGLTGLDACLLDGFDLERLKAGSPLKRLMDLRDAGTIHWFGMCVSSPVDALWCIDHAPARILMLDAAPEDYSAWDELLEAGRETGVGLLATSDVVGGSVDLAREILRETTLTAFSWPAESTP